MKPRYATLALFWALVLFQYMHAQHSASCHNIFQAEWCEDSAWLALHYSTMHGGNDSVQIAVLKGRLHFELLDFEQAIANFQFAIDAGIDDAEVLLYLAYSYLLNGMSLQAETAFALYIMTSQLASRPSMDTCKH